MTSARSTTDGFLKVVDRKKEMIITSAGKNIAPSNIENLLKESPLVGHALAYGDSKPYVVAILTLDAEVAPVVAGRLGVSSTPTSPTSPRGRRSSPSSDRPSTQRTSGSRDPSR